MGRKKAAGKYLKRDTKKSLPKSIFYLFLIVIVLLFVLLFFYFTLIRRTPSKSTASQPPAFSEVDSDLDTNHDPIFVLSTNSVEVLSLDLNSADDENKTISVLLRYPDYATLLCNAVYANDPEQYIIESLSLTEYPFIEKQHTVPFIIQDGTIVPQLNEIIQTIIEQSINEAVFRFTEE